MQLNARPNGYIESFNGKLRDELLNGEIFDTLLEAKVLIERWRREYNTIRPHSALGYVPPAPEAKMPRNTGGKTAPRIPRKCAAALTQTLVPEPGAGHHLFDLIR